MSKLRKKRRILLLHVIRPKHFYAELAFSIAAAIN